MYLVHRGGLHSLSTQMLAGVIIYVLCIAQNRTKTQMNNMSAFLS